ncbi:hypothetical protein ANO14919_138790 [Xylariales sp. No.14919]|nr:hypothetical protein ANO14919_138790 [Xylariales sp. No.14919]
MPHQLKRLDYGGGSLRESYVVEIIWQRRD